ncbi:MAG: hypothetical protein QM640_03170 [Niabella sp.]
MKKLKLSLQNIEGVKLLTRDQLKKVMGGIKNPEGDCKQEGSACDSGVPCCEGLTCSQYIIYSDPLHDGDDYTYYECVSYVPVGV